jgi:hypothetical protein
MLRGFIVGDDAGELHRKTLVYLFGRELAHLPDIRQGCGGAETHRENDEEAENKERPSQGRTDRESRKAVLQLITAKSGKSREPCGGKHYFLVRRMRPGGDIASTGYNTEYPLSDILY